MRAGSPGKIAKETALASARSLLDQVCYRVQHRKTNKGTRSLQQQHEKHRGRMGMEVGNTAMDRGVTHRIEKGREIHNIIQKGAKYKEVRLHKEHETHTVMSIF